MKLTLSYKEVMNEKFNPGPVNLMMVFQVNCPGCFIHGFPLLKELQTHYHHRLSCFALATAFEDFHVNTEENVKLLVNSGQLVGETLKAQKTGMLSWDKSNLSVPILVDEVTNQAELLNRQLIENIMTNMFDQTLGNREQQHMRTTVHNYFSQLPKCGKTFATNLMRGTPSFFLFTDSMEILVQWFGHADSRRIKKELDIFIDKKHG